MLAQPLIINGREVFLDTQVTIFPTDSGLLRMVGQSNFAPPTSNPYEVLELEFLWERLPADANELGLAQALATRDIHVIYVTLLRLLRRMNEQHAKRRCIAHADASDYEGEDEQLDVPTPPARYAVPSTFTSSGLPLPALPSPPQQMAPQSSPAPPQRAIGATAPAAQPHHRDLSPPQPQHAPNAAAPIRPTPRRVSDPVPQDAPAPPPPRPQPQQQQQQQQQQRQPSLASLSALLSVESPMHRAPADRRSLILPDPFSSSASSSSSPTSYLPPPASPYSHTSTARLPEPLMLGPVGAIHDTVTLRERFPR